MNAQPEPEKLYTLEEARQEIARQECKVIGHDYEKVVTFQGLPISLLCSRCGDSWLVVREGFSEKDQFRAHLERNLKKVKEDQYGKDQLAINFYRGVAHAYEHALSLLRR